MPCSSQARLKFAPTCARIFLAGGATWPSNGLPPMRLASHSELLAGIRLRPSVVLMEPFILDLPIGSDLKNEIRNRRRPVAYKTTSYKSHYWLTTGVADGS